MFNFLVGGTVMPEQRDAKRYRRRRPHCGGWWLWKEDGDQEPSRLFLTEGGTEVVSDDELAVALGRMIRYEENYWETTTTDQQQMPGLWMQV